jgi:hypothetical protein
LEVGRGRYLARRRPRVPTVDLGFDPNQAPKPDLGAAIRWARVEGPRARSLGRPLLQRELGQAVGTSAKVIAHYETGFRSPELARLVLIAAALGLGVWLLWKYAELVGEVGPEAARAAVLGELGAHNESVARLL